MCSWSLDLIFKAKLKLQFGNLKIQYGCQAAILKVTLLKIKRLLPIYTSNLLLKFGHDIKAKLNLESGNGKIQHGRQAAILNVTYLKIIKLWPMAINSMHMKIEIKNPKQTRVTLRKPCHLLVHSPVTEKSNMATRRPFWRWHLWKSLGSFPYTQVMFYWSLDLKFKAKLNLDSGNKKIQYGYQAAIFKVASLKWIGIGFCP